MRSNIASLKSRISSMKSDEEEEGKREGRKEEGDLEKLVRELGMADLFPEHADMLSKVSSNKLEKRRRVFNSKENCEVQRSSDSKYERLLQCLLIA